MSLIWKIKCSDKNGAEKIQNFGRSTKTNSPTSDSGATSLPPMGDSFMYIETSSNNHGNIVFVSWERTDIAQITNITFYYNRHSISSDDNLISMGRFRIQLLLVDNTWSTRYSISKNDQYSDASTDWTLVSLNFTVENYGIKLVYDEIDTTHADMCFSKITITHSVFYMKYEKNFKDLFESKPDCRKIVLVIFLIQNGKDELREVGFSECDVNRLNLKFKNILLEEHEKQLEYVKNLEESIVERFLNK